MKRRAQRWANKYTWGIMRARVWFEHNNEYKISMQVACEFTHKHTS